MVREEARPARAGRPATPARRAVRMWLRLSSGTSRLSGISAASSRARSSAHADRRGRAAAASGSAPGWRIVGDIDARRTPRGSGRRWPATCVRRCSSLKASHCSRVPSGRNCEVNTCRNVASSRPQPTRASSTSSAASPALLVGVGAAPAGPGRRRRRARAGSPARGGARRRRSPPRRPATRRAAGSAPGPTASTTSSRSSTQASKSNVGDVPVRQPAPALVVADQAPAVGEALQPVAPHRALPVVVEVGHPVGRLDERRARADVA